jgi:DNA-binding NarL/FixJ family response regulator
MPYLAQGSSQRLVRPRHSAELPPKTSDAQHALLAMQPLRTFIVEDSPVIRENLIATLEELLPLQVVGTAEDEATAVHWLVEPDHPLDLLIVDIFLKQGTGLGVLRAAAAQPQCRHVVVQSNFATPDMRKKCLELGADRVFDKSNEIEALIQYCDRLANGNASHSGHGALT